MTFASPRNYRRHLPWWFFSFPHDYWCCCNCDRNFWPIASLLLLQKVQSRFKYRLPCSWSFLDGRSPKEVGRQLVEILVVEHSSEFNLSGNSMTRWLRSDYLACIFEARQPSSACCWSILYLESFDRIDWSKSEGFYCPCWTFSSRPWCVHCHF